MICGKMLESKAYHLPPKRNHQTSHLVHSTHLVGIKKGLELHGKDVRVALALRRCLLVPLRLRPEEPGPDAGQLVCQACQLAHASGKKRNREKVRTIHLKSKTAEYCSQNYPRVTVWVEIANP